MKTHRIGVRVSVELHTLLAVAGDVSAATRALAILGADAVGYELGALRDEAASLLIAPLDPPLRAALRGLLTARPTTTSPALNARSTAVPPVFDACATGVEPTLHTPAVLPLLAMHRNDPLADVGIDV